MVNWLWPAAGTVLGLVGLIVLARAVFADRSRGRPRCPRCWYLLKGIEGATCPECGHVARSQRALFRTRRRWRVAMAGLVLVACGLAVFVGERVQRHGWLGAVPTSAYITLLPQPNYPAHFRGTVLSSGLPYAIPQFPASELFPSDEAPRGAA